MHTRPKTETAGLRIGAVARQSQRAAERWYKRLTAAAKYVDLANSRIGCSDYVADGTLDLMLARSGSHKRAMLVGVSNASCARVRSIKSSYRAIISTYSRHAAKARFRAARAGGSHMGIN